MAVDVTALVIDRNSDTFYLVKELLEREFGSVEVSNASSLHHALESQNTTEFNVCFISDKFAEPEVGSFFRDMHLIGKDTTCLFVQMRDSVADSVDRESLKASGFSTIISSTGSRQDRAALKKALHEIIAASEARRRVSDINNATKFALREIDRTASDIKRGFVHKILPGCMRFVDVVTKADPELLSTYFDSLTENTSDAEPVRIRAIEVPDTVLKRNLPRLERSRYFGASNRVWEMLKGKHGVTEDPEGEEMNKTTSAPEKEDPDS